MRLYKQGEVCKGKRSAVYLDPCKARGKTPEREVAGIFSNWCKLALMTNETPTYYQPEPTENPKQRRWDAIHAQMTETVDGLGKEIDEGILNTVIALNALGFSTTQSCEGHLDWGIAAPWIDINPEESGEEKAKLSSQKFRAAEKIQTRLEGKKGYRVTQAKIGKMHQLWSEGHALQHEADIPQLQLKKKLLDLLGAFYSGRSIPFDQQLSLATFGEGYRLICQGADIQNIAEKTEREAKLTTYQSEMRDFCEFAKKKYFE